MTHRLFSLLGADFKASLKWPFMTLVLALQQGCAQPQINNNNFAQPLPLGLNESYAELVREQPSAAERAARTETLLREPLTPNSATQLMLLNSPHLQVELARLGEANAARVQAGLISNPRFSLAALRATQTSLWQWDLGLSQSLGDLMTRSLREKQASSEWMMTQLKVTQALQLGIHQLQQTYFAAIAAQQNFQTEQHLLAAAEAKRLLAEALFKAGNISELAYLQHLNEMQEQARAVVHQQQEMVLTEAELHYLLGLNNTQVLELPVELPALPNETFDATQLINEATQIRVDMRLAKLHQQQLVEQRGLIRREFRLADSNVGVAAEKDADGESVGPQVELTLPIFDRGHAKLAMVDAQIAAANAELIDAQLHAMRDIKKALAQLEHTHKTQLAEARATAAKRVELAQREVNYMLASPFDLLDLKIAEIQLQQEQTTALLSYWQARSQLELALGRSIDLTMANSTNESAESTSKETRPAVDSHRHHVHESPGSEKSSSKKSAPNQEHNHD